MRRNSQAGAMSMAALGLASALTLSCDTTEVDDGASSQPQPRPETTGKNSESRGDEIVGENSSPSARDEEMYDIGSTHGFGTDGGLRPDRHKRRKQHQVSLTLAPDRLCQLDQWDFLGAVRDAIEGDILEDGSVGWATALIPVLHVKRAGENLGRLPGPSLQLTGMEVFVAGQNIGAVGVGESISVCLPPLDDQQSKLVLEAEACSGTPVLRLAVETCTTSSAELEEEGTSSAVIDLDLGFTTESLALLRHKSKRDTVEIYDKILTSLQLASSLAQPIDSSKIEIFASLQDNVTRLREQADPVVSLRSAVNSEWLRTLSELPAIDDTKLQNREDCLRAAAYMLQIASLLRSAQELHRVYAESEVVLSICSI